MPNTSSPSGATRRYRGCGQEVGVVFGRADDVQDRKNQDHFSPRPTEKSLRFNSSNGVTTYSINIERFQLGIFVCNNSKLST